MFKGLVRKVFAVLSILVIMFSSLYMTYSNQSSMYVALESMGVINKAHAAQTKITVTVSSSYRGQFCSGCDPGPTAVPAGSTINFYYDDSDNSFWHDSPWKFVDSYGSLLGVDLYNKSSIATYHQYLESGKKIVVTTDEMDDLKSSYYAVGKSVELIHYHGGSMQNGYPKNMEEYIQGKITSKVTGGGGGSCSGGGSSGGSVIKMTFSTISSERYSLPTTISAGTIFNAYYDTSNNQVWHDNPYQITDSYWSLFGVDLWQKPGFTNVNKQWLNAGEKVTATADEMKDVVSLSVGETHTFSIYHGTSMSGGTSPSQMEYVKTKLTSKTSPGGGSGGGDSCGGGVTTIVNNITNNNFSVVGSGSPLIEIPRFDYNHSYSNVGNITINQSTVPGANLGEVKDNSKASTLKGSVTNIPNNGIVYITGGGFQPNILVQNNNDSGIVPSGTEDAVTVSNFLKNNGNINTFVNSIDLNKHSIEGKTINDFKSIYSKCDPSVDGVECTNVNSTTGVADLNDFKITKPGRYLVVVYLKTADGKEFTYYKVVDARTIGEFTGLPIQNRLTAMVENKSIKEKTTSKSHQFNDMQFTFSGAKEKSLSVPSVNNSLTNRIVLGSTEKGVKLLNNDLTPTPLSGVNLNNASITDVVEVGGTTKVVLSSSNEGCLIIDTKTGNVVKVTGLLSNNIQSIELKGSLLYIAFDNAIGAYFIDSANSAHLRDSITSQKIFGSDLKLGELNLTGSIITINTHHSASVHKMAIISKF